MQKQFYFLSPVEVVKVTLQNLAEVADWCGGKVASTESRRVPGRMDSYVWVPTPKGTAISWAFPGMFVTKRLVRTVKDDLRVTYAVFRKDYFEKNYFDTPIAAVDATWEKDAKKNKKPEPSPSNIIVNVHVDSSNPEETAERVKEAVEAVLPADTQELPKDEPQEVSTPSS
jgi:hypothetical protein